MNCLIPGTNIKVLNKALLALHRISEELYIECRPEHLSLIAMNANKTVYAKYNFRDVFFLTYEVAESDSEPQSEAAPPVSCKLQVRSLLTVFKQKMERKVDTCTMRLEKDATTIGVRFKYIHDVTMVHNLRLIDFDYVTVRYTIDDAKNVLVANGHVWTQVLSNFQLGNINLTVQAESDKTTLWNYDISVETIYKGLRSQVVLARHEFQSYKIGEETTMVLNLKPLRSAISFAEHFNLDTSLYFKTGGAPCIVVVRGPTFDMMSVLSTVNPDSTASSTVSTTSSAPVARRKPTENRLVQRDEDMDLTAEDREVLQNVDWDDVEMNASPIEENTSQNGLNPLRNEMISTRKETNPTHRETNCSPHVRCSFSKVLERLGTDADKENTENEEVVPGSPVLSRARIFQRCFDPTLHASMLDFGEVLAPNSDSDDDT